MYCNYEFVIVAVLSKCLHKFYKSNLLVVFSKLYLLAYKKLENLIGQARSWLYLMNKSSLVSHLAVIYYRHRLVLLIFFMQ